MSAADGQAHIDSGPYMPPGQRQEPRRVEIRRVRRTPADGTEFCSCCHGPHTDGGVRIRQAGARYYVLICLKCARRVGRAAK